MGCVYEAAFSAPIQPKVDISYGVRHFSSPQIKQAPPASSERYRTSLYLSGELETNLEIDNYSFQGRLFANWDQNDEGRQYANIRQASTSARFDQFTLAGGVGTFFWGVSETINLLNTINQSDLSQSIDGKVKMGQSFISASYAFSDSQITLLHLPKFVELEYPDRPRSKLHIDQDNAIFEDRAGDGDFALRWESNLDLGEVAISLFQGTRRDPLLIPNALEHTTLIPYYLHTKYIAFDGLLFVGDAIIKSEMKHGQELDNNYYAFNLGVEYPTYPDSEYIQDITLIAEYLFDDREEYSETMGQKDIFFGGRGVLGQLGQIDLRTIMGIDLDNYSKYLDLSITHRLTDYIRWQGKGVWFIDVSKDDQRLSLIENEDFIEVSIHFAY